MEDEQALFDEVRQAHAGATTRSMQLADVARAELRLSDALADFLAVANHHPELQALKHFRQPADRLAQVNQELESLTGVYNAHVRTYNAKIQAFPNSIIAQLGGFRPRVCFGIGVATPRTAADSES